MNLELAQKNILVTGSSRGIGLAIARGFLAEGAKVILTSRNQNDLVKVATKLSVEFPAANILNYACDFVNVNDIKSLRENIEVKCGKLDVLVVNVGSGVSVNNPIPDAVNFQKVFRENFDSVVFTVRELYPLIKETKGAILLVASIAGLEAFGAPTDYSVAKSAVISFAKNLARKVAVDGVRVNCIAPGNIIFDGGSWDQKLKAEPERIRALIENNVPMKRFGAPEEIADTVVFLCSKRSSFTTGACLTIDGGQTVSVY